MLTHLLELRHRLLCVVVFFFSCFTILFFFSNELYNLLITPLRQTLPPASTLIATRVTATLLTPIQVASHVALLMTAPIALFHLWQFIAPGLYPTERQSIRWILASSLLLFVLGGVFCFYFILPYLFEFFLAATPPGVNLIPDMTHTVEFITRFLLLFGLAFQVPLICLALVRLRLITREVLIKARPYVIVAAFVLGLLLTPPDVLSQLMLAIPLCLLYELGVLLAFWFRPR